jgi:UDP-N-acetylglucosamine--N-acetylmuramyl-(pentapeptide) pyrophosphoryl-undecaprenol N-acetylglucosamine transferase
MAALLWPRRWPRWERFLIFRGISSNDTINKLKQTVNLMVINIAFTGGGTGGHIFPILAVAEELSVLAKDLGISLRLYYIGPTRGPIDIDLNLFQGAGVEVQGVGGKRGIIGSTGAFFQSLWHLYFLMPDIIFSKGGYGAAPTIAAAIFYRIPFFIHESDAVPGKANLLSARFAKRIAIAFDEALPFFPKEKTAVVGNPIRPAILETIEQKGALQRFGLVQEHKTIFFIGGSQGASSLNEIILDILPELIQEYQVIHQCGARNFGEIEREAKFTMGSLPPNITSRYKLYGFLSAEQIRDAYTASDLVISRAGSGSIFEIAAQAKPAILIPFKFAAQNHQRANAYAYAKAGAAAVLEEENLTPHIVVAQIKKLMENESARHTMSEAARGFAKPDPARKIAEELLRSVGIAI